jgi:hypothetical protein
VSVVMFRFFTGNIAGLLVFNPPAVVESTKAAPNLARPVIEARGVETAMITGLSRNAIPTKPEFDRCLAEIGLEKSARDVEMLARHCYLLHGKK